MKRNGGIRSEFHMIFLKLYGFGVVLVDTFLEREKMENLFLGWKIVLG